MKELEENPVITFDSIDYAEKCRRNSHYASLENDGDQLEDVIADDNSSPIVSLRIQFSMCKPTPKIERLGYALIYLLDENGYLCYDDVEKLAQASNISLDDLKTAIDLLQSLEPAGVGAFNPRECILLQLERKGLRGSDAWVVAQDYLEMLSKNQLPQIAKKSGIPLHRVVNAQQLIRTLNPKPLMSREQGLTVIGVSDFDRDDARVFTAKEAFSESGTAEYSGDVLLGLHLRGVDEPGFDAESANRAFPRSMKNTYGTGCFFLMNTGDKPITSKCNLVSSVAWGVGGKVTYALEGSVFNAGSVINWLRDGLGIIQEPHECDVLAESVHDTEYIYFVPAFTGLGAPYWDMETLYREFGDQKYRPHPLLRKMVRAGQLGCKSGQGFYSYANGEKTPVDEL